METDFKLERLLVFFDLETTHLDVNIARIVEIALVKLFPDGTTESFLTRINPGIPIPAESTRIHGINNFDVMDKPTFQEIAVDIESYIKDCDLAGYNLIAYDLPILINELKRAGIEFSTEGVYVVDVMTIFKQKERLAAKDVMEEYAMNGIDYVFLRQKQYQDAFKIFKLNVEAYPEAFNVYDSLGEAYMENGDKELAIKNYEKSLALNPDNENGKKMLEKLRQGK
jgi:DNA polymerase-3 subunit epsilon